jgi:hypothetical protein
LLLMVQVVPLVGRSTCTLMLLVLSGKT